MSSISLLMLLVIVSCTKNDIKQTDGNGYINKQIKADLSYNEFMPMKTVYFEIDNLLYCLTIIDGDYENKVIDLRCKPIKKPNGLPEYYLYTMRTEYYGDRITTTTLLNNEGFMATYMTTKNILNYEILK